MEKLLSLLPYVLLGIAIGFGVLLVALYWFPRQPKSKLGKSMRRFFISWLHGITEAEAREVSAILLGGERIPSEEVDKRRGNVYVGICACGCQQKLYYSGRGKRPKYVNQKHIDYARKFRSSWE